MSAEFKTPKRAPSRHSHLERLLGDYSKAHGIAPDRMRRWISTMTLIGALDRVRTDAQPRFLVKGGVSMELRLGLGARSTQDVDIVFRGRTSELTDALEEAFEHPYSGFDAAALDANLPADVHAAGQAVTDFIAAIDAAR